jgi:hypothetical protein
MVAGVGAGVVMGSTLLLALLLAGAGAGMEEVLGGGMT